jgi:putative tryptophan/tyrosine transport system substrate-binding protein
MKRRDFITLLSGAAAAWPLAARAQQPAMPVIGFLSGGSAIGRTSIAAFRQGLRVAGFIEGQNVRIEFLWADRQYDRLPALAAELVAQRVTIIVAVGSQLAAVAAKAATSTIPIVFNVGSDPVGLGLVASLNRPGANATGTTMMNNELVAKRMELLHDMVPRAKTIGYLQVVNSPDQLGRAEAAASALGIGMHQLYAAGEHDFEAAFATLIQQRVEALLVGPDPIYTNQPQRLIALAAHHRIPAMYAYREMVVAGGLVSYGANPDDARRQLGEYCGRVLKGEKPADLPVMRPSKFEFVINLKVAKALELDIPLRLHAFANEVIE